MWTLIDKREEAKFVEPDPPDDLDDRAEMKKFKMKLKRVLDKQDRYQDNKAKVFRIIMGQCDQAMKGLVERADGFSELEEKDDVIGLLGKIRDLAYTTDNVQYEFWTMQATIRRLITMKQETRESLDVFAKRFQSQQEVTEDVWGKLIPHMMKGKATEEQEKARHKFLACDFLAGVDGNRYGKTVDDLNNDFLLGTVSYPVDVPGMLSLLSNRRGDSGGNQCVNNMRDGMEVNSFVQGEGRRVLGRCYCCGV
jgi:hypothetical protein